ncbi:hypothetical protein OG618_22415 [Kitasatospora sp. NBC_01246]|uniref:hypothetical protein n=1 Tax=Kitasatospora sp. NBC_01246 TaxID=2903570 RepID=UPI002E37B461|nr:hypothetical protein [Kitasatospora sp. NBC_01246]
MRSLRPVRRLRRIRVVRLRKLGRKVGTAGALGAAGVLLSGGGVAHAETVADPDPGVVSQDPAAAQFGPVLGGSVGGDAGLLAVGGGLVVAAGGAALWLKRRRAGDPVE